MSYPQHSRTLPHGGTTAAVGGLPSVLPDVPICAVLLVIYIGYAATNMTILQINRRRGYKFLFNGALFGFCMARIATLTLRIAWANRQHNVRLAIAASILLNAGVLIAYVLNVIFTQRILRGEQPQLGWHRVLSTVIKVFYAGIGAALAMVITAVVLSAYTYDEATLKACRDVSLAAGTYLLVFTTIPLFLLGLAHFLPTSSERETFGQGSMRRKKTVVLVNTLIAITISGFKTGTSWMPPRPITDPAWYDHKACLYVFNFALEITIISIYTIFGIHKLFFVPNGSKGPGDYTRLAYEAKTEKFEGSEGSMSHDEEDRLSIIDDKDLVCHCPQ